MRGWIVCSMVAFLAAGTAAGDDGPAPPERQGLPKAFSWLEAGADAVLAAIRAGDDAAISGLAEKGDPDPWLVADTLLLRGESAAALRFSRASSRKDVAALPAYVASRPDVRLESAARWALHDIVQAIEQSQPERVEEIGASARTEGAPLTYVRIELGRGLALREMGRLEESAKAWRRAAEAGERVGWLSRAARCARDWGIDAYQAGDFGAARDGWTARLRLERARDNRGGAAEALGDLGSASSALGDLEAAKRHYEQSLELMRALGRKDEVAKVLGNLGSVLSERREWRPAAGHLEEALQLEDERGDREAAAWVRVHLAPVLEALERDREAVAMLERAAADSIATGDRETQIGALANLAALHLRRSRFADALRTAREAVAHVTLHVAALPEGQRPRARATLADTYEVGALAAVALADAGAAFAFLEEGRAGALRELLGSRADLQDALLSKDLRDAERRARTQEAAARKERREAEASGDVKRIQAAEKALREAQEGMWTVASWIRRESGAAASVLLPQADDLATVRARLAPGDALVSYGALSERTIALVATRETARVVDLGSTRDVEAATAALAPDAPGRPDVLPAAAALRARVWDPLGLGEAKRVLVSPDGPLTFVPFALLEEKRTVALVSSATVHGLLLADRERRGERVLALGDPVYGERSIAQAASPTRGSYRLGPLPATRKEAEAVGDERLLGPGATEEALRAALATNSRWRSVHLACHGHVDADRPLFCGLVLTSGADDDGFLTVLDVFRMKIPADLVVLSACETARGRIVRGEGIVGLTRAFMFAGAPRVLCALWKVDDEATSVLMKRFYASWNPKDGSAPLSTAAALAAARTHVRTLESEVPDEAASRREGRPVTKRVRRWEHPVYWAAWTLWGLAE